MDPETHVPPYMYTPYLVRITSTTICPRNNKPAVKPSQGTPNMHPYPSLGMPYTQPYPSLAALTSTASLFTTPLSPAFSRPQSFPLFELSTPIAPEDSWASIHSVVDESRSAFMMLWIVTVFRSSGRLCHVQ